MKVQRDIIEAEYTLTGITKKEMELIKRGLTMFQTQDAWYQRHTPITDEAMTLYNQIVEAESK